MSHSPAGLPRTPEPPSENPAAEANLYAELDHCEVNQQFVDDLLAGGPVGRRIIDLGCGPADILIRLAGRLRVQPEWTRSTSAADSVGVVGPAESVSSDVWVPEFRSDDFQIMGIDNEVEMLQIAKREIDIEGFLDQIFLELADLEQLDQFESNMADVVISNTAIHHLQDPARGIAAAHRLTRSSGRVFLRDLARPASEAEVEQLVGQHGSPESEAASQLLRQSLHAAITISEVQAALRGLGVEESSVQMTSDRHWTIDYIKP